MPDVFSISPANPIHFRTETGANTINSGVDLPSNYLYADIGTFYNCAGIQALFGMSQCFRCDDNTAFQVTFDTDTQAPIFPVTEILWAELLDENGGVVAVHDWQL